MSGYPDSSKEEASLAEQEEALDVALKKRGGVWEPLAEVAKYTVVLVVLLFAFYLLKKKLGALKWSDFLEGLSAVSYFQIFLAVLLTGVNYTILAGYDLIAVVFLRKKLSLRRVMTGAVIGYSMSNMFGWIIGGTAFRYRLYTSWGFTFKEVVAFVSILSMTFWLGMFLLAGVSFVLLPVHLPTWAKDELPLSTVAMGWLFLGMVAAYLLACALWHKPIRWGNSTISLPPLRLSAAQLLVSAADFALASAVLYVLLPSDLTNFSTVMVTYLAAMIVVVSVHVPGGFGILELIMLEMLTKPEEHSKQIALTCALVLFRIIYYFCPAIVAGVLFLLNEWEVRSEQKGHAS